jgi:hypothetical protein
MKLKMSLIALVVSTAGLTALALGAPQDEAHSKPKAAQDKGHTGQHLAPALPGDPRGAGHGEHGQPVASGSAQEHHGALEHGAMAHDAGIDAHAHLKARHEQDRAQRKQAQRDPKAWQDSRPQRAEQRRKEIAQTWGDVTKKPSAQSELKLHAERMARLNRALDIAEQKGDQALIARVKDLTEREIVRDARVMDHMKADAGAL